MAVRDIGARRFESAGQLVFYAEKGIQMDTIGDIAVRKIGQFDPVPIEEAHCDECGLPVLTNSTPCAAGAYEGQPCRPSMEPKDARLDQFKIFIQGELSPDEIRWMAELAADFLCSDKVKAWRTAGLATEYRAALAEAHPIGNTDKLTALVERLIADLAAARKEIADFEASWACP